MREFPALLHVADRHHRHPTAAASLHLAEHHQVAAAGNDVELARQLALGRAPVPVDDVEPERAKACDRTVLTPPSSVAALAHGYRPVLHPTAS